MSVPFLDLAAGLEELGGEVDAAFARVRDSGRYILGPEVEAFEREFAKYCGARHCVGVANGFDAIQLLLRAAGVGSGDEVLVPAYTAVATWMAVSAVGAVPVGVDVDARTWTLDPGRLEEAIGARTKAILPVHLFGLPADMGAIAQVAARHRLLVFEDAAQAHGAHYQGRTVGSLGRAAAFSFYPTKNLGALGDGGAVVTDDEEIADNVRLLHTYGWRARSDSEIKGLNSRLDELQAALLRVKLARLDDWNERRRRIANRYREALGDASEIALPFVPEWAEPVWHLFVISAEDPQAVRSRLERRGIGTLVHYDPLPHLTPAYRADGWSEGMFRVAEDLASRALSLPMHPQLSAEACGEVVAALLAS